MLLTNDLKIDLLVFAATAAAIIASYFSWSFSYWKRRGLQTLPPSFPFGNATDLFFGNKTFGELWRDVYFSLKSKGIKHGGAYMFAKPYYIPVDLDAVKCVLQSDFPHFTGRGTIVDEEIDPLSGNLFLLDGNKWKNIRNKFSPAFTGGKMKMMFTTMVECSVGFKELLENCYRQESSVNVKDLTSRFTIDVIGSVIFGIECNSMKNPNSEFRKFGHMVVSTSLSTAIRTLGQLIIPHSIFRFFKITSNDPKVSDFFTNLVNDVVNYREKNNITRPDFLHLLLQLKNKGMLTQFDEIGDIKQENNNKNGTITLNDIIAQCFLFFVAGFETSSSAVNFAAYELAVNPDIQEKVRNEINTVLARHDNKMTYEAVMEMNYLDKVICETLRKHPSIASLFRVCNEDYKLPGSDVVIEKGTQVIVPLLGFHYDPEYFPDPFKFDPERFSEENKAKRHHYSWIPFGEGPRICIGLRFGKLQTKLGLIALLRDYSITLNKKTRLPFTYKKTTPFHVIENEIWIDLHKI